MVIHMEGDSGGHSDKLKGLPQCCWLRMKHSASRGHQTRGGLREVSVWKASGGNPREVKLNLVWLWL